MYLEAKDMNEFIYIYIYIFFCEERFTKAQLNPAT